MEIRDLGLIGYRNAWAIQEQLHERALGGGDEALLLLEHNPVITFGRRAQDSASHLMASQTQLEAMGVEIVESDRGGDITFHGPGQLVAYPILRVAQRGLSPGAYVHKLEDAVIATLADLGITSFKDPKAPGTWVEQKGLAGIVTHAKICALGVRIKRGVSLHGIALNVTTDLRYFELINPCGLSRPVTTIHRVLGEAAPDMQRVKQCFASRMVEYFGRGPAQQSS